MTHRIGRIVAAALLATTLCAAPALADDHIAPTDSPHGAEWGQVGDPLPEDMGHIDHDRQQAELEGESPQGGDHWHVDVTAPDVIAQADQANADYASNPDFWAHGEPMAGDALDAMEAAPVGGVGDQAWTVETVAPQPVTRTTRTARPSLPSTGN